MTSEEGNGTYSKVLWYAALGVVFLLLMGGLQYYRHDAVRHFSDFGDEPSHFMTGVLIRDYALHGFPNSPTKFAYNYYLHYPKIAFGSWPPFFHFLLGVWLLALPVTRLSALLFVDITAAAFGVCSVVVARRYLGLPIALAVGVAALLAPVTQELGQIIQADLLYGVFSVTCPYLFALWLSGRKRSELWWFGILYLAALATKNNAMFLGISLPLMLLLTRSFGTLKKWALWLAVLPGTVFCGIWQYLTLPFVRNNMLHSTTLTESIVGYSYAQAHLLWIGFIPLIIWSLVRRIVTPVLRGQPVAPFDAATLGVMVGPCFFHAVLPHDVIPRYLLPSVTDMLIFAAQALCDLAGLAALQRLPQGVRIGSIVGILVIPEALACFTVPSQPTYGYANVAEQIVRQYPASAMPSILISAGFAGEAAMIAELASRDSRPGYWLLRSTKVLLRRTGGNNRQTKLVSAGIAEMQRYFEELPLNMVILSHDGGEPTDAREAQEYLVRIIQSDTGKWELVMTAPVGGWCRNGPCTIDVYRLKSTIGRTDFSPQKLPSGMPLWSVQ